MSTHTFEVPGRLEILMNDRRVRMGGLIAGVLVIFTSIAVVNISNAPSRSKHTRAVAVLPDAPLNSPILRQWPYPDSRHVAAATVAVRAPASKVPAKRVFTARR